MSSDATAFDGKAFVRTLTTSPGVYRMFGADDALLYVGKARNLRKRVGNYFLKPQLEPRIASMVSQIARMEVTLTRTEGEALLLEAQLIKSLKPRYNIMLRDDKSYPYIFVSDDPFPRIVFHRGAKREKGRYFGPYPSAHAVRESITLMQRLFRIRNCENSYFRNRTRPCLQYQIGRCTAPCVAFIGAEEYAEDVRHAVMFLEGRNDAVLDDLSAKMEAASALRDYERAARLRDQIATLRGLQAHSYVQGASADMDVFACRVEAGIGCVSVLFFRNGISLGSRDHFPKLSFDDSPEDVLGQFLAQYYLDQPAPAEVVCDREPADAAALSEMLSAQRGHEITLKWRVRGERARFVELAARNAEAALLARLSSRQTLHARFEALRELLQLDGVPMRVECFDISHTMGEETVASCVVFGPEGPLKQRYRRFNIRGITGGDDYAAMRQALERRFKPLARGEGEAPDVLLIDGGKGQVAQALDVLRELGVTGIEVIGVAKGPSRRVGEETLVLGDSGKVLEPGPDSPALHLIDAVRDEAHRFAITGHRKRREKARERGLLEDVPGIGASRRAALLKAFGGHAGVVAAGVEELCRVRGINRELAERIHAFLHG
ncbi:MAG: excinuclease ABC subunit UvrC [Xanthomonadales bacterium]|nr:excinuclease ABC subunit UvrC [Xanthomonadales bacterium]ODU95311.1 MAG: excinuclease ABC subunit C [Rhodanobacter sp. SCN 66-43]OJY83037.1 MAG: excinuclease ABC subunit C [Xanthomonadales bacterium 66-474]